MKLSNNYREILTSEFKYVASKMREDNDAADKSYYYSAAYGMAYRILNLEYSHTLLFIHHILQTSHSAIQMRTTEFNQGQNRHIPLISQMYIQLADELDSLAKTIESSDDDVYPILERIHATGYICTGNGYYLFQKGILEIS